MCVCVRVGKHNLKVDEGDTDMCVTVCVCERNKESDRGSLTLMCVSLCNLNHIVIADSSF